MEKKKCYVPRTHGELSTPPPPPNPPPSPGVLLDQDTGRSPPPRPPSGPRYRPAPTFARARAAFLLPLPPWRLGCAAAGGRLPDGARLPRQRRGGGGKRVWVKGHKVCSRV